VNANEDHTGCIHPPYSLLLLRDFCAKLKLCFLYGFLLNTSPLHCSCCKCWIVQFLIQ
jgi:hypothetical protein